MKNSERWYIVEVAERHSSKRRVLAASPADAARSVLDGLGEDVDNSTEYIETDTNHGMPAAEDPELAEELRKLGVPVEDYIPGIYGIEEDDDQFHDGDEP